MPIEPSFSFDFTDSGFLDLAEQADYVFPHPIQRVVLPLTAVGNEVARPLGTGFLIGPGILVTARHVVEPVLAQVMAGELILLALYLSDQELPEHIGYWGGPLRVLHASMAVEQRAHDLALLTIEFPTLPDGNPPRPNALAMTFAVPPVDSPMLVLGYSEMEGGPVTTDREGDNVNVTLPHKQRVRASNGRLREVHAPSRDSSFLSFPVFRADYHGPNGMSGGPVIGESGKVVGVVCTGHDVDESGAPIAYASLLAPLLGLQAHVADETGAVVPTLLWDLLDAGRIISDGTHRLFPRADFVRNDAEGCP